ncbi:hypothetical protein [Niabella sp.]|uniref:hypothetical protein n=1 Tax=Niabella sp. TaxID=1962976 RepID=UPI002607FA04|nr:hypothetical protein [Niabella sp.]
MKKLLTTILNIALFVSISGIASAQDFVLNNGVITPAPAIFPGGTVTITYDFYTTVAFDFQANGARAATITFSFTKMDPTGKTPTGTGADLFTWVLSDNGQAGQSKVYTWTGTTKAATHMNDFPTAAKYKIVFTGVPVTFSATQAASDIRVAGQFTDPAQAPAGNTANNFAEVKTYSTPPLPVNFKSFDAKVVNNALVVNWATVSETNNDYFEIQVMDTDTTFRTIGTVLTKAANAGTSDSALEYSFTKELDARGSLMGIAMFALGFIALLFNKRNKMLYMLVVIAGMSITTISCRKESKEKIDQYNGDYRVRVVQVDKAGLKSATKVALAVKE